MSSIGTEVEKKPNKNNNKKTKKTTLSHRFSHKLVLGRVTGIKK